MAKELTVFVKVRNSETGERRRERLCYLSASPNYLYFEDKYFFKYIKTLQILERCITGKDVNYELEIISDNEIAVESFNKQLKDEPLITFYNIYSDYACILNFINYLKEKTDDKYLLQLMGKFYDQLRYYSKGVDEYYALNRYVDEIVKDKNIENSNVKSRKR